MSDDRDAALVRACRAGDRRAFEELVGRYERPVFNAAYRILHDRDDAKDVTQTVFMKAYEHLDRFDTNQRFFSWIYRIAVNEAMDAAGRRPRNDVEVEDLVSDAVGPQDVAVNGEADAGLQDALMALNPDQRTLIVLKHLQGCSYEEIAAVVDCPAKTVKSRLFSAREALRAVLVKRGFA
jgi:RNA polymerase sigma-70 factor (ECF subfamily)